MDVDKRIWRGRFVSGGGGDGGSYINMKNVIGMTSRYHRAPESHARYCDKARLFHFPREPAPVYINCVMYGPLCRPDAELAAKLARMTNALTSPETLV